MYAHLSSRARRLTFGLSFQQLTLCIRDLNALARMGDTNTISIGLDKQTFSE